MKLIIDIDKDIYERITRPDRLFTNDDVNKVCWAVYNGIPISDNATVCDIDSIKDVQKWERVVSKAEVLEKIRAEIQHLADLELLNMKLVLQIIDKYTK